MDLDSDSDLNWKDSDLDSDSRAVDLDSDSDSDIAGLVTSLVRTSGHTNDQQKEIPYKCRERPCDVE